MRLLREVMTWRLTWLPVITAVLLPLTTLDDPVRASGYFLVSLGFALSTRTVVDHGLLKSRKAED